MAPLTFAKFPVAAVGQKFCQGQKWRPREGRRGKREGNSAEAERPRELGWGWLGPSCLWVSGGAWSEDSGPQGRNLHPSSDGHSLWGLDESRSLLFLSFPICHKPALCGCRGD